MPTMVNGTPSIRRGAADGIGGATKLPLPEAVADDGDRRRLERAIAAAHAAIVGRRQQAAGRRVHAEQVEEARRSS